MGIDIQNNIFVNYYDSLNADQRYDYIKRNYYSMLVNGLCEMFDIDGLTNLEKCTIMNIILSNGTCLIDCRNENEKIIASGNYYGVPERGKILPPRYLATKVFDTETYTFDDNPETVENVTVAYINPFLMPCTEFISSPLNILSHAVSYATLVASFCTAPIGAIRQNFTLLFNDTSVSANIVLYLSISVHGIKNGLM